MTDPDDFTQIIELEALDDPGFTQIGHWVSFCRELSPTSRKLYDLLAAFVNQKRRSQGDTDVWPSLELLATSLCLSKGELVTPYMDELIQIGAIAKRTRTIGGMQARNVYGVRFNPPPDWTGPVSIDEIMADAKFIADDPDKMRAAAKEAKALISKRREAEKVVRAKERKTKPKKPKTLGQEVPRKNGVPDQGQGESAGEDVPRKTGVRTPENRGTYPEEPGCNNTEGPTTRRSSSSSCGTSTTPTPQESVKEDEDAPSARDNPAGGDPALDDVIVRTDATADEAGAVIESIEDHAQRHNIDIGSIERYVTGFGDRDLRRHLKRVRAQRASESRSGAPAAGRPARCGLHLTNPVPCQACRNDLNMGGDDAEPVLEHYAHLGSEAAQVRPDLAAHPAVAALSGTR